MKPCHVIALSLVSWYLLVPMFDPRSGKSVALPLGEWNEEGIFDNEKDCTTAKRNLADEYKKHGASAKVQSIVNAQASCVLSDDPRLEGKVPFSLGPPVPTR